ELRLGKIRAGFAQDFIGALQLAVLALQCLDALAFFGRLTIPHAAVTFGLTNPRKHACAAAFPPYSRSCRQSRRWRPTANCSHVGVQIPDAQHADELPGGKVW